MNFDPITYAEAHQLKEHFRLIYGSYDATLFVFDPGVTGPSLQTWLATPANLDAFEQLLATYIGPQAVIASSTAMAAVAASSTAMAAVAASSTAMAAVAASSTALMAVHAADTALNAIKASATAIAAMRGSAKYLLVATTSYNNTAIPGLNASGSYIVVGLSTSNGQSAQGTYPLSIATRRPGSSIPVTGFSFPSSGNDGKTIDLAIPLVYPFSGATNGGGHSYAIGVVRCDV